MLGQARYQAALHNPDSLANVLAEDEACCVDSFGGRLKQLVAPALGPSEEDWTWSSVSFEEDEAELERDLPRLFAKFWS